MKDIKICIFGDDLTRTNFYVDLIRPYYLQKKFDEKENNVKVFKFLVGQYNITTDSILKADNNISIFEKECTLLEANTAIIALGINDAGFRAGSKDNLVPIEKFQKNLHKIKEIADRIKIDIAFLGLTKITGDNYSNFDNNIIFEYDGIINKFCLDNNLLYIGINSLVERFSSYDGKHFSSYVHEKIANEVYKHIKKFIYK